MAATAFMPYSIGQTEIISVEEFNTYYDMLAVIGEGIPSADTYRVSFDNFVVRGSAIIRFAQEYDTAYESSAAGVGTMSSVDLKRADDADSIIAVAVTSAVESYAYGSFCVGYGVISAEQTFDTNISASISAGSEILFIHSLRTLPRGLGRIYDDKSRVSSSSTISGTDGQGFAIEAASAGTSSASAEVGIDYSLTTITTASPSVPEAERTLCLGATRFAGADSTVAIYRLIEDSNSVVGKASPISAYVRTLDDWWLFEHIPAIEYETIPKANRIVVGSAQAYNSNYEVVGVGHPLLVNEPVFTLRSTISAFEDYEPSFLRVVISIVSTIAGNLNIDFVPETPIVVGSNFIFAVTQTNNERSRYGGDGFPPAVYGDGDTLFGDNAGRYSSPRGSTPDVPLGGGVYIRTLGGYVIGVCGHLDEDGKKTEGELTVV